MDSLTLFASIVALVSFLYFLFNGFGKGKQRQPKFTTNFDLNNQSRLLPGKERVRASVWGVTKGSVWGAAEGSESYLLTADPEVTTVYENFLRGKRKSNNGDCMGWRSSSTDPYKWVKYGDVLDMAHHFGSGLVGLGAKPGQETHIGIYSANNPNWQASALGIVSQSMVVVPLYDTLGPEATSYIVNQADIQIVVCDTVERARVLLNSASKTPTLRHVIVMKPEGNFLTETHASSVSVVSVHAFHDVVERGKTAPTPLNLPKPDDVYIICYTSGTTGNPKGVVLTHKTLIANASCYEKVVLDFGNEDMQPRSGDTMISYLPLAHMFEQVVHVMAFFFGARIGFFQGNIRKLTDDMKALKPYFVPTVPRVLNRLYDEINAKVKKGGPIAKLIFNIAYFFKWAQIKRGIYRKDTIWDKLIFNKIQKELGGDVLFVVTGSAPVSGKVLNVCRVALGCPIMEGYGQTECTAGCTTTLPDDLTTGQVGPPIPACHVKLVDVPDLNYFAKDDKGEVCVRGPIVMKGYFREPEKTAETLDEDGWLHTGDIGMWLPNGALKIIDRKKHIFKLAQGEYVAPEKIEEVYSHCPLVQQLLVDGISTERFLIGIAIPNEKELEALAREKGQHGSLEELCENKIVRKAVLESLQKLGKEQKLNSIEQIQALHLTTDKWTVENGLLTPTLKTKRPQMRKHYEGVIEKLYEEAN